MGDCMMPGACDSVKERKFCLSDYKVVPLPG